jgi:hypothetical protein
MLSVAAIFVATMVVGMKITIDFDGVVVSSG